MTGGVMGWLCGGMGDGMAGWAGGVVKMGWRIDFGGYTSATISAIEI